MATSGKATHGALPAALLVAVVVTVALFSGTCTAQAIDAPPVALPYDYVNVSNSLWETINFTVTTNVERIIGFNATAVIGPGESKLMQENVASATTAFTSNTITVDRDVYNVSVAPINRILGETGTGHAIVSSPCPDYEPGLLVTFSNSLTVPIGVGNVTTCTGPPIISN